MPLRLLVVALCDEVEVRLSVLVARELLFHDLPADRLSVLDGRQRVAEPRCVGPEAPEGSELLAPRGVTKAQPITRRFGNCPRRSILGPLDARDQPETAVEANDAAWSERIIRGELAHALHSGARDGHDLIMEVAVG